MKKNILMVANHGQKNHTLLDWYGQAEKFSCTIADSHERAIELAHQHDFDLIIADSTDSEIDIKKLQAVLPILNEGVEMVTYAGESVDVLDEMVRTMFEKKKAERLSRMLILDAEPEHSWKTLPAFSAN